MMNFSWRLLPPFSPRSDVVDLTERRLSMPTFKFDKPVGDIEDPVLLPRDWYDAEIWEEPEIAPNSKLSEEAGQNASQDVLNELIEENEKMGMNLVVRFSVISPEPTFQGRKLTVFIPYPHPSDDGKYDGRGMNIYDAKMDRIVGLVEACGASISDGDDEVSLAKGMKCQVYVDQRRARDREELENSIDLFAGFKEFSG